MNIEHSTSNIEHPLRPLSGVGCSMLDVGCSVLIFLVRLYRLTLSPAKTFLCGPLAQCRFTPSCSEYSLEALQSHGAVAGSRLAVKRICRCHPWGDCGHDPVPRAKCGMGSAECGVVSGQS